MMLATLPVELNQATDVVTIVGSVATVMRSGVLLWRGDLLPISIQLTGMLFASQLHSNRLVWEGPMPIGTQLTPTKVVRDDAAGVIRFTFSNGVERELNITQMEGIANSFDGEDAFLENLAIAIAFRNSPDGSNVTTIVGASLSCNLLSDQKVIYTPPVS